MNSRHIILGAIVACIIAAPVAVANDSEAAVVGGNIILKKSKSIAMESEDLLITSDSVRVSYIFRNTSASDVITRVAFPLVIDIRGYEDQYEGLSNDTIAAGVGFELMVDGVRKSVASVVRRRAGKLEITFHWEQTFPAGKSISVVHQYQPLGGSVLPGPEYQRGYGEEASYWRGLFQRYCMDAGSIAWLKKNGALMNQVPYILRTGANWKGPIGRFHLTIRKSGPGQIVSTCLDGLRKANDTDFVMERRGFVPKRDLSVLFITGLDAAGSDD